MHEETADKLFVAESDLPFGLSRFFPRAEKVTSVSETESVYDTLNLPKKSVRIP